MPAAWPRVAPVCLRPRPGGLGGLLTVRGVPPGHLQAWMCYPRPAGLAEEAFLARPHRQAGGTCLVSGWGPTSGHARAPPHEQRGLRERYLVRPVRSIIR
jgi:hypothetical protein